MASFDDAIATFARIEKAASLGAMEAANMMANTFTEAVKRELSALSHPFATKTPSPPGAPPAMIDGALRDSMYITPAFPIGPAAYMSKSGPTVRYARIQELGGWMEGHPMMHWFEDGVAHWSTGHWLPKRPYMRPVEDRLVADGTLSRVAAGVFKDIVDSVM